jgi:hypothetical protein
MKKALFVLFATGAFSFAQAQPDLPQPSPKAVLSQTVGLTEVTIEYSSPAVNGRSIWGSLVPYGEVWRTGANAASKITFSRDVKIGGKDVKAGSYAIYTIPGESSWTVIINKDYKGGASRYSSNEDVVRLEAKPAAIPHRERLSFQVVDFNNDKADVSLEWEKVRVSFSIEFATAQQALNSIDQSLNNTWRAYANSARYLLDNNKDLDQALKIIDQSIALNETWFNSWIKAQILAKKGNKKEARNWALKAKELGDKQPEGFFFKADVEKAINDWK